MVLCFKGTFSGGFFTHRPSESLYFQQVFFVESVCDDPEVIAANIMVCTDVLKAWLQTGLEGEPIIY